MKTTGISAERVRARDSEMVETHKTLTASVALLPLMSCLWVILILKLIKTFSMCTSTSMSEKVETDIVRGGRVHLVSRSNNFTHYPTMFVSPLTSIMS